MSARLADVKAKRIAIAAACAVALGASCGGSSNNSPPVSTKGVNVFPGVSHASSVANDANQRNSSTTLPGDNP